MAVDQLQPLLACYQAKSLRELIADNDQIQYHTCHDMFQHMQNSAQAIATHGQFSNCYRLYGINYYLAKGNVM
jgi:hypothetical protein